MPAVPWVRPSHGSVTEAGERQALERAQLLGGRLHQQADLPVAGVIAEGDRRAVGGADAALGAEDEELWAAELARDPSPCRRSGSSRRGRRWARRGASPRSAAAGPPVPRPPSAPRGAGLRCQRSRRIRWPSACPSPHSWVSVASAHRGLPRRRIRTAPPCRSRASVHASCECDARPRPPAERVARHASVASARSASAGGSRPLPASRSWKSRRTATPVPARLKWRSRIARISRQPTRYADAWVGEAA